MDQRRRSFVVQLLDHFVAIPIAIYYLSESGQWEDVLNRVKKVFLYLSSCNKCLDSAKRNKTFPQCHYFCKECFKENEVCQEHQGLYEDWNGDSRLCESCMAAIRAGNTVICQRFRIVLSISDQASAYEKLGREISQDLREFLLMNPFSPFLLCTFMILDIR